MTELTGAMTLERAHVEGLELVRVHTKRFVAVVNDLDAQQLAAPAPSSSWTVGDVVAHVQSVFLRYTVDRQRAATPAEVATSNARDIETLGVDAPAAVVSIEEQLAFLDTVVALIEPTQEFPFHAGQPITMAGGWGNLLGELLAHGDDIARAVGTTFTIPSADLEIMWRFASPVLRGWVRSPQQPPDSWVLHFPFGAIQFVFDADGLTVSPGDSGGHGHHIAVADAAELALAFPYRRRAITDPVLAALADRFVSL